MTSFPLSSLLVQFCSHSSLSSSTTQLQPIHHAMETCFRAALPFPHPQELCLSLLQPLKTPHCLQEALDLQQSSAPCRKGCRGRKVGGKLRLGLRMGLQTLLHAGSTLQAPQKTRVPCCSRSACTHRCPWPPWPSAVASWLWSHCIRQALDQARGPP